MLLWKTIDVADNERVLLFRRNRFETVLDAGRHRVNTLSGNLRLETFDLSQVLFEHPQAKFLFNTQGHKLKPYLDVFEVADKQIGLLYRDGHLVDVLAPGTFMAAWKGVEDVRVEILDISTEYSIDDNLLDLLSRGAKIGKSKIIASSIYYTEVPDEHVGLLLVNGRLQKLLQAGSYGYWKFNRSVAVKLLDLRLQSVEIGGQDILTKDRVSLRVNLSGSYRINDPETVALKVNDYAGFVYRELQLRLREIVGTRTLDELLEDKDSLNNAITVGAKSTFADYGVMMVSLGVKDIILPGDMKQILNQVVEAQKESEANLIKRREETQAMRSLHNTAKMMENNPVLMRLKELEALEKVTARIDRISVYGGLEGVLNDLVKLAPSARA